jgi:ATP-binding cassette subfamily B protein
VTHDIEHTRSFDRVLVVDQGRIVEDGVPEELAARPDSAYASLLRAEAAVRTDLWSSARWRRWRLQDGTVSEDAVPANVSWAHQSSAGR